jgi:hypothetical protein
MSGTGFPLPILRFHTIGSSTPPWGGGISSEKRGKMLLAIGIQE